MVGSHKECILCHRQIWWEGLCGLCDFQFSKFQDKLAIRNQFGDVIGGKDFTGENINEFYTNYLGHGKKVGSDQLVKKNYTLMEVI